MRKIALITLTSLLCLSGFSYAKTSLSSYKKQNSNVSKSPLLVGDYHLFNYNVKISLNKDNKLILTLPLISESVEQFSKIFSDLIPAIANKFPEGVFLHKGDYELVKISDSIFMIKYSGGYSIELKKEGKVFEKKLVLHNDNFDTLNNREFNKIILTYKTIIDQVTKKKFSDVKANMHTFQTTLEIYAVDNEGIYPNSLNSLSEESKSKYYWKDLINPFTNKSGIGKDGSVIELKDYKKLTVFAPGLVIFEPKNCPYNTYTKKSNCTSYIIYGTNEVGGFIQEKGGNFYLSN